MSDITKQSLSELIKNIKDQKTKTQLLNYVKNRFWKFDLNSKYLWLQKNIPLLNNQK